MSIRYFLNALLSREGAKIAGAKIEIEDFFDAFSAQICLVIQNMCYEAFLNFQCHESKEN